MLPGSLVEIIKELCTSFFLKNKQNNNKKEQKKQKENTTETLCYWGLSKLYVVKEKNFNIKDIIPT